MDKTKYIDFQFIIDNYTEQLWKNIILKLEKKFSDKGLVVKQSRADRYPRDFQSYLCCFVLYSQDGISLQDFGGLFDVDWSHKKELDYEGATWRKDVHEHEQLIDKNVIWAHAYFLQDRFLYRDFDSDKFSWRITKYNPKNRDKTGAYLKDEWIDYSDIENSFEGEKLTFEAYKKIEEEYVAAISLFMDLTNTESLSIVGLERNEMPKHDDRYSRDMVNSFTQSSEGLKLNKNQARLTVRLILRNNLWCRLESEAMFVHFGYDYYMYIGSSKYSEKEIKKIEAMGLFVEDCKSPDTQGDDEEPSQCSIYYLMP